MYIVESWKGERDFFPHFYHDMDLACADVLELHDVLGRSVQLTDQDESFSITVDEGRLWARGSPNDVFIRIFHELSDLEIWVSSDSIESTYDDLECLYIYGCTSSNFDKVYWVVKERRDKQTEVFVDGRSMTRHFRCCVMTSDVGINNINYY